MRIIVAAVAMMVAAVPAEAFDTRSREVSFADLDLRDEAGVERLRTRVRLAAKSACGTVNYRDFGDAREHAACVANAVAHAQEPMRIAVAAARSGRLESASLIVTR